MQDPQRTVLPLLPGARAQRTIRAAVVLAFLTGGAGAWLTVPELVPGPIGLVQPTNEVERFVGGDPPYAEFAEEKRVEALNRLEERLQELQAEGTYEVVVDPVGPILLGLAGLLLGFAAILLATPRHCPVEITSHGVRIDGAWVPAVDLVGCVVEAQGLRIDRLDRSVRIGPIDLPAEDLEALARRVRAVVPRPEDRQAEQQARAAIERSSQALLARATEAATFRHRNGSS